MPGTVLNAFHSVSHLISQSNDNKTYTITESHFTNKETGRGVAVGGGIVLDS